MKEKTADIDILEEKEKKAYDNLIMLKYFTMEKEDKESIDIILKLVEALIAENKALKDSNVELATTIDCLQTDLKEIKEEYSAEQKHEMENTIPKSKVEEIIHNNKPHIAQEKLQSLLGKE